ncbi:ABC transporter ATP-binding protein [Herbaspirillum sp. C7C8]|jgi:branched-chain amino acid transport system ATP-binding protein|uniref:ABC transporter ATP-binding protein n=1 Tax=Herbaspirillum sp. C7C8 TaxID=2736665 RepID=UPI001F528F5F|nr:ABC transporter ATP-binding protein [Herbaspirillum sp. C7C8]MCI1007075.1 ABC transporter ATP-binding protein [Herbaspirillum sp. C7C8]
MSALLQTRGLQLAFGGVVVADSIDFELRQGERLAVIGQNGAGKTTFINICTGFIRPTGGSVHFDGRDITRMAPRAIVQRGIGRSFQLPQLFLEHTVRDCIRLAAAGRSGVLRLWTPLARVLPDSEIDRILDLVGLRQRADDPCALLPEGQRKLLDIAMALVLQPKLLIMDEPTSGVSTEEKHGLMAIIMRVLDEQKITSIFVEHDVDIVTRYATRVAAWISGRIAADGEPGEVLGNPEIRRNVIGE